MTNTEAVIKATTEYDLTVLPELVERLEWLFDRVDAGSNYHSELELLQESLDRLKRRGE